MKIVRIDFSRLHNEEWFQFFTEFKVLAVKHNPDTLDIAALFAVFLTLYAEVDKGLVVIRKSPLTEKMNNADVRRDQTYRGLIEAVRAFQNHFSEEKREAARRLFIVFDTFGNLSVKPANEETAGIYNLLQELNGDCRPQVELLGVSDWVKQLETDNDAYEALVRERNTETAARPQIRLAEKRTQAQQVYAQIVERIEALAIVHGETAYAPFVGEWNAFVQRYSHTLSQRKGRKKNSPDSPDAAEQPAQ
ncbi:MAG: DUF6261 family protein [Tannerella sp.]|jgi:hypothetical protein|nr:DUF6261 family protein [Tannerella sp.]